MEGPVEQARPVISESGSPLWTHIELFALRFRERPGRFSRESLSYKYQEFIYSI
jgi:hypothetical protein